MVFGDSVNFISVTVDSVDLEESYETDRQTPLFSHTATITGTPPSSDASETYSVALKLISQSD